MIWLIIYWAVGTVTTFLLDNEGREKYGLAITAAHFVALILIFVYFGFLTGLLAIGGDLVLVIILYAIEEARKKAK